MAEEFSAAAGSGRISYLTGTFETVSVTEYALVIAASGDGHLDDRVAKACRVANIPVNVVDRTDLCTFIMPSIVDRGDVVIGISTSGSAPVLARRLREKIEALLPARLSDVTEFARAFRSGVKGTLPFDQRRGFWQRFF